MATPGHHAGNSAGPDTPINIKISVNDSLKKLKLPLKDLGANVLIDKLRHYLNIKPEQQAVFERFSDSAGGYIILEPTNPQVFKTLIRAAKAKSKLRLKATVTPDLTEKKTEEAPSTQDVPSMSALRVAEPVIVRSPELQLPVKETTSGLLADRQRTIAATSGALDMALQDIASQNTEAFGDFNRDNQTSSRDSTALDGRSIGSGIFQFREARASQQTLVEPVAPVPRAFTADRSDFFNSIARAGNLASRELAFRSREPATTPTAPAQGQWSVYCNSCDVAMYDAHYHCSICDGGDYDLCEGCIASGTLCPGDGHWLIKRSIKDGKVVTSTTERIGRKAEKEIKTEIPGAFAEETKTLAEEPRMPTRTCNNCVYVLPEDEFVTCTTCDDFDLCVPCHESNKHGHHPAHGLRPATDATALSMTAEAALAPGRHVRHNAICDGCDKTIFGIRHKCLDCPDWDYCSSCVGQASLKHSRHRFTAIYSPIAEPQPVLTRHVGIYCDGPLCKNKADQSYVMGIRYKCAVCNDTDFCASCEALPGNHHNRTHPLIKFKTPVKNVSITTMNEDARGHVRNMGDKAFTSAAHSSSLARSPAANAASEVKTVAEIKPEVKVEKTQPIPVIKPESKIQLPRDLALNTPATLLSAEFVKDSIPDGMAVEPGARFTQIWTLKNDGAYSWPAGCSVRYVGGDNMLNVDNGHPASVAQINDATESNVVGREVQVGEDIAFKLVLKAPLREGKAISYWRVKAADGTPFGHRLWCDIEVKSAQSDATEQAVLQRRQRQQAMQRALLAQMQRSQQQAPQSQALTYQQLQMQQVRQQQLQHVQQIQQAQQQAAQRNYAMQREAAHQMRTAPHDFTVGGVNNGQSTQQATTFQPISPNMMPDLNPQKESAKLRVERIKANILKTRAEKHNRTVLEAKAARAAADKKGAEEDAKVKMIIDAVTKAPADETEDLATSQMVFPKLEKESPEASIIQSTSRSSKGKAAYVEDEDAEESAAVAPVEAAPSVSSPLTVAVGEDFEDFTDLEVLSADGMESEDDGFLTDEEYDILDASDQETVASK